VKRTIVRLTLVLGVALLAAILVLAVYVARTWDRVWDAPLPDLHASSDPRIIERGSYLVFGPAHCVECHVPSAEDYQRFADAGERPALRGGQAFPADPLGAIYSRNITPDLETGIGRVSDPQIARMLRYSVRADGRSSVLPLMPYGDMSDDDIVAVLSFLRAQPAVRNEVPAANWTLTGKIVKSLSSTFKPRDNVHAVKTAPESLPSRARGEYLARSVGNCGGCHSPLDQLTFALDGPEFSGGVPLAPRALPGVDKTLWFKPPNLTPLRGSALNRFPDRETFVARFQKGGQKYPGSPMPWECFARLTAEDAGALYEFFRSVAPAGAPAPEDPTVKAGT
jgi:mono/diheme cytochrome c family protein